MIIDKKLLIALGAIAVVAVLVIVYMSSAPWHGNNNQENSNGTLHVLSYHIIAYTEAPTMEISFSRPLSVGASVLIENYQYSDVAVYACTQPTSTVYMKNITPPNLIGHYLLVVYEENKEVLNKSMVFQQPTIQINDFHINKVQKGDTVYIVNITINITENGNSPFYYSELRWSMDNGKAHVYKLPREHLIPNEKSTITLYVNQEMSTGEQHTIDVNLSFYTLSSVQFTISFST